MSSNTNQMQDGLGNTIGQQLRALRKSSNLSLLDVAEQTGVSEATMSRVETGLREISAPHLFRLAALFQVDIGGLFHDEQAKMLPGVRSVSRKETGRMFATDRLNSEVLCSDLQHKRMHPFINFVKHTTVEDVGGLSSHEGEEYVFVISGQLELHTHAYAPLVLTEGDSVYFDASSPHAYVSAGQSGVRFLSVCSAKRPNADE